MLQRASKEPSSTTGDAAYAKLLSSVQTSGSTASHAHSHAAMPVASHTQKNNNLLTPPYRGTPHPHAPSQSATKMLHAVAHNSASSPSSPLCSSSRCPYPWHRAPRFLPPRHRKTPLGIG
ncbi:unnamed protein product [Chondrus crispus]|uniref:Uncharacterized protein n=1 Tax=Chondrus crispus TaxID=2769 RepID=R7QKE8_CHOCR|nr:unnamed protein product [Chondrus crispus]CDF38253.1 unnamed protein product [Chondrus crispus]|eukprot:XP_005718138.1 unnamed protein product [Chondrus crispus]